MVEFRSILFRQFSAVDPDYAPEITLSRSARLRAERFDGATHSLMIGAGAIAGNRQGGTRPSDISILDDNGELLADEEGRILDPMPSACHATSP
jgi:hypothetical protein